jgi:thioredoxin-related protein
MKNKTVHLQKIHYLLTIICCASLLLTAQTTPPPQKDSQLNNFPEIHRKEGQYDSALELLLKKSARYCQKLKKVTFNFTCTKEVIDNHWYWGGYLKDDLYLYHYQMVREENGEMNEEGLRQIYD